MLIIYFFFFSEVFNFCVYVFFAAKANLLNKPSRLYTVRSYAEYHRAMSKQSVIKKTTDVKRTQTYATNSESSGNKRRASGSAE